MANKPQPMCAVTFGFETYLLPSAAGMKLVDLMQQAVACERDYGLGDTFTVTGPVKVMYRSVQPSQIVMPHDAETEPVPAPKRIAKHPLRLARKD